MQTENIMLVNQMLFNKRAVFLTVKYVDANAGRYRLWQRYGILPFFLCLPTNRPPSQIYSPTTSVRVLVTAVFWVFVFSTFNIFIDREEILQRANGKKQQNETTAASVRKVFMFASRVAPNPAAGI